MATLALCMSAMVGELNGTWKLARTWARAGHRIVYACVADGRSIVEANGFEYVGMLESRLPAGSIENEAFYYRLERMSALRRLISVRRRKRQAEQVLADLARQPGNEVEQAFRRLRPDLVIVGTHTRHPTCFGLIAAGLGIPAAYLTQQMIQATRPAPGAPVVPVTAPPGGWPARIRARGRQALEAATTIDYSPHYRALLTASGQPAERCDYESPRFPLRAPILYPWPRPFELPDIEYTGVIRIETGVDPDRPEATMPLDAIPRRAGLVFCSFGAMLPIGVAATRALLRTVIDSMRPLAHLQMVLAVGPYFRLAEFGPVPSNVHLCQWAPQMTMLKRSDVVITHGGSSTVRECLLLGVPMIVIPLGFESGEYARRVAFHRVGVTADHRTLSPEELTAGIRTVRENAEYRRAVMRMRAAFERWEREAPSVKAIEWLLAASPANDRARPPVLADDRRSS